MKITVVTRLSTIWDMQVKSGHKGFGLLCTCLLLLLNLSSKAQESGQPELQTSHFIRLEFADSERERLPGGFKLKKQEFESARIASFEVAELVEELHENGWLLASVDSTNTNGDTSTYFLQVGEQARWLTLSAGNVEEAMIRAAGFRERWYRDRPFRYAEVVSLREALLGYAENNGYPFAEVWLDDVQSEGERYTAKLVMEKNRFIKIDSIRLAGTVNLSKSYLSAYLGIKAGQPYNEGAIRAISNRIRELPFLREVKPPEVFFNGDGAFIGLFLEEVNASNFDFLVGVLPNSEITGRLTITGEGSLDLRNVFGAGEGIRLDYRQLQLGTKEFEVAVDYPYLPFLPFGTELDFELYLRDSSFLDRRTNFGLTYLFGGNDVLKGYIENKRTIVLGVDTASVVLSKTLPVNLDVVTNRYGLQYSIERLDYRYNPRKGFAVTFGGSGGTRRILTNEEVLGLSDPADPEFDFATLYDSIDLRTASFTLDLDLDFFQPIGRQSALHFGLRGGWIYGGELFTNELYRLGGARSLRGFDEESIFASLYQISTLEYRFLLGQNSLFYLFGDVAYLQEKTNDKDREDWPFGFGAGMNFETGAGIFGLSYALGRQQGNPIEFRAAKIHFGYVNRF